MVPLYKNKGDIQNSNNHKGIKYLSHTMKIWDRVMEMRVRKGGVSISQNEYHAEAIDYRSHSFGDNTDEEIQGRKGFAYGVH